MGKYEEITEGQTIAGPAEDWSSTNMGLDKFLSWEEFKEKQYFVFPVAKDWEKDIVRLLEKVLRGPGEQSRCPLPPASWRFIPRPWPKHFPDR